MNRFRRILFIVFISPVALIIVLSTLNLKNDSYIKVLTWRSTPIKVGYLVGGGALIGALLGSLPILINTPRQLKLSRKVIVNSNIDTTNDFDLNYNYAEDSDPRFMANPEDLSHLDYPPQRSPNDPVPTVAVKYRVIKKNIDYDTNSSDKHTNNNYIDKNSEYKDSFKRYDQEPDDNSWFQELNNDW